MKKYLVVALIVLVGGALIIVPLLPSGDDPIEVPPTPAMFAIKKDFGTTVGKESILKIEVTEKDVKRVDLVLNSVVLKSWKNPKGTLEFSFAPEKVGTFVIQVVSTDKEGRSFDDNRYFKVLSDIIPERLKGVSVNKYSHNTSNYTQGLEFYKGRLFESTGQYGQSKISEIDIESGVSKDGFTQKLDGTYFGEGITILDDLLYQLTWKKGKCFVYSLDGSLQMIDDYDFIGQDGWGICNDGKSLIMSDGTERLTFRNPQTFQIEQTIDVYNATGAMTQLNELEYVNGKIYANVYHTNLIVVIDPATGKILQEIDCTALEAIGRGNGDVLNGIAYNHETDKMYVTGKNWINLFEVEFVHAQ